MQNNNDFKYVIQDTGSVYFGRELTYAEIMDKDDVPFKFKAIINAHIAKDTDLDVKMTEHLLRLTEEEFSYRIFEQLKLTIRICYKEQKKGFGGKIKETWLHKKQLIRDFKMEYCEKVKSGDVLIEDISISKLALMAISI